MVTRNSNFKLSKSTKRMLATVTDPHKRGDWKETMIKAEIAEKTVPPRRPKSNGPGAS
jgi:hypothetical protein